MSILTDSTNRTNTSISFIISNKGQRLLVLNDHIYRCNKKTTKKKYWICIVNGCTIHIHTDENDVYISGGKGVHDHETNPDLIDAKCLRQQMKQRVINELTPIGVIYEEEMAKTPLRDSATAIFPTNQELYQTFAKLRQKHLPALPQSSLFIIPDPFKLTVDGKRFLLYDEARVRRERLLIYASDIQLDVLFKSSIIYMDGTFSKAPKYFVQVYIIHGINYDTCVPCVFVLMVNKKSKTYRQIFFELKQLASERQKSFSPQLIVTDFESGVLPVVKTEFPTSTHYGCHFHYNQCLYRQIQQLGLQTDYSRNELIRGLCRKIMALALMPNDTVLISYNEIRDEIQKLSDSRMEKLLNYFETQWMINIDTWNVSRTDTRTNNTCEGGSYHNRMNHRILRNHSDIWKFIQFMQKEEQRIHSLLIQWSAGASRKKDPRSTALQNRYNTLYERYDKGLMNISSLLKGFSLLIGGGKK